MRLRVVNLYNAGPCRFVGCVQYNDRLAGEILHNRKLDVSSEKYKTTYEQAVYISIRFNTLFRRGCLIIPFLVQLQGGINILTDGILVTYCQ